jgi:hypothetical protein
MNHPLLTLMTFLMFYVTFFIDYHLALTFIDLAPPLRRTLLPVLNAAAIAYISKICLEASAPLHTAVMVIICAGVIRLFNPVNILLSLIGSLLTIITVILGSMVMACPVFVKLGYAVPSKLTGLSWMFLNLLELVLPALVLVILKARKVSLLQYLSVTIKRNF